MPDRPFEGWAGRMTHRGPTAVGLNEEYLGFYFSIWKVSKQAGERI